MPTLDYALAWASRGFEVFPLYEGTKIPLYDDWPDYATSDEALIRSLWTDPVTRGLREYNIGVKCNDMVVIDVDVKLGKDGHNEYMQLGGTYETLVVQTPSGGYHCYFEGPDSGNASISNAVDVRSHNGYVLAPGSIVDGVPYTVVVDRDLARLPDAVGRLLRAPYERSATGTALDTPASVEAGISYAGTAPAAIEGQRGDETTFIVAARLVREFALSVVTAYNIMAEYYNPRCVPPWSLDELYKKVENAAAYGSADMGRLDPSVLFSGVDVAPPPSIYEQRGLAFGNALVPASIPARPWLMDRLLMRQETTVLLAPGSAGKSSVALAIAAHMAVGQDFGKYRIRSACCSIVYNGEDNVAEQSRRLYALCVEYGLDFEYVKSRILLLSADEVDLMFAFMDGSRVMVNDHSINQFIQLASDENIGLVVYDPLVDIHSVRENDNNDMNTVMKVLKRIGREANVASLVVHHSQKGGSRQEERVGNMEISRGASAIVNKARIAVTLLNATMEDVEHYGIPEEERNVYVRMDDAKMQFNLAATDPVWFSKVGVKLVNGDVVGVLRAIDMKRNTMHARDVIGNAIIAAMEASNTGGMLLQQASSVVKTAVAFMGSKSDTEIKKIIEGYFTSPYVHGGKTLRVQREVKDGATAPDPKAPIVLTLT